MSELKTSRSLMKATTARVGFLRFDGHPPSGAPPRKGWADSTSQRKNLGELLHWCHESKRFAWTMVQTIGNDRQPIGAVEREIRSLRHVLTKQAVGVLVGAALPGAVGVAEVDLDTGVDRESLVARHLPALVPGDTPLQLLGERRDGRLHRGVDLLGFTPIGEMQEHDEARRALNEGADSGTVIRALNEVTLPVARHGPIVRLGGSIGDHDLSRNRSATLDAGSWAAFCTARPKTTGELTTELASGFDEE